MANSNRKLGTLPKQNRWASWRDWEVEILKQPTDTDYEKAKKLSHRTDASVRVKRRRMGFTSRQVEFKREFTSGGYVHIRKGDGYKRRCRLEAEKKIGRELKPNEIVHHINGVKNDDRPENLHVCSSRNKHNLVHHQTMEIINELMEQNKLIFKKGRYILCQNL